MKSVFTAGAGRLSGGNILCARFENGRYLATEGNDSAPQVTPDGKYLFFQSNRADSGVSHGLYWVDASVLEALRPKAAK